MGVTGLWRLIEPAGKPVPVETLENKVLAVDISIWLHQMVKGYQDAKGAPLANAHLMGLFQRLCKLLYFRIKPVFVFDGAFPALKKDTISKRQDAKQKYNSESERIKRELAILLTKKTAIGSLLGKQISPKKASKPTVQTDEDLFKLPAIPAIPQKEDEESESDDEESSSSSSATDLHSIDLESQKFKTLPAKEKYDLLLELKETRKMNSWGRLHELPKKSDNFSDFQLQRLLKRRKVQECLEETEKEIGDAGMSLNELESLLNEEGIDTTFENLPTRRIASNNTTRFLLINDVKQALADAKKKKESETLASTSDHLPSTSKEVVNNGDGTTKKDELEEDLELAIKMSLECANDEVSGPSKTDDSWTSYVSDGSEYYKTDSEEEEGCEPPDITSAKAYIIQYSDYTNQVVDRLTRKTSRNIHKGKKKTKLDEVLEDLNCRKVQMVEDGANLTCSDDEVMNTDSDVVEVLTVNSDDEANNTQASVAILDNPKQEVIILDSSMDSEKTREIDLNSNGTNVQNIEESNSSCGDLVEVSEIEQMINDKIESETNDSSFLVSEGSTTKTISSVESNNQFDVESTSNDKTIENVPDIKKQNYNLHPVGIDAPNKNGPGNSHGLEVLEAPIKDISPVESESNNQFDVESDSSTDNDFEDVPAPDNKPGIELTLNVNETLEDEIFADIFTAPIKCRGETTVALEVKNNSTKSNQYQDNEDDELQKAIMMSLECVDDNVSLQASQIVTDNPEETETVKETLKESSTKMSKVAPQISKTLESLNTILMESAKTVTVTDKDTTTKKNTEPISKEQLNSMVEDIQNEEEGLHQEKGRLDRIGRNITEQMTKEAQELLQIFGIPYIVAPMEAEAQCAFLESVNLTDGTITDDSDIWLFGGKTVYKNFFNQKKHVLQFLSERIEKSFNLSREQLILLALLVGSDYTTGIDGVGPVTAMEILASFPFKRKLSEDSQTRYKEIITGLQEFKQWVRGGKRTDNTTLKKKLRNIVLNDDFPSVRVVQAYLDPNVEKSEDKFSWGELDITILRDYTKAKFGWSQNKLDEIIKPVLKTLVERKSQKSMHDFFKKKIEFQSLEEQMSKRVKAAVQRIGPKSGELEEQIIEGVTKEKQGKRKLNKGKEAIAGPSRSKRRKTEESVLKNLSVKVVSEVSEGKSGIEIKINKTDRYQEIIPQREKDKQSLLQNKMKAIELFRKTNIDKKKKLTKRKPLVPKDKAELSESDSD